MCASLTEMSPTVRETTCDVGICRPKWLQAVKYVREACLVTEHPRPPVTNTPLLIAPVSFTSIVRTARNTFSAGFKNGSFAITALIRFSEEIEN